MNFRCRFPVQSGRAVKNGANENVAPRFVKRLETWVPKPNLRTFTVTFVRRRHTVTGE